MSRSWDVWQDPEIVAEVLPALGVPESVFAGTEPVWMPRDYLSVVDVGCGPGVFCPFLSSNGAQYLGVDSSPLMIQEARTRNPQATFAVDDALKLSLLDNYADLAWCSSVLIHIPMSRVLSVLTELRRVARKYVVFNAFMGPETRSLNSGRHGILQVWGGNEAAEMVHDVFRQPLRIVDESLTPINQDIYKTIWCVQEVV